VILKSWKEIANHLHCGVRTAQRWEKELGLPIRRPAAPDGNIVLAFTEEMDEWVGTGTTVLAIDDARANLSRQAELRQELSELRARQRQLISELRQQIKQAKQSTRIHLENKTVEHSLVCTPSPISLMTVDDNASQCYAISQVLRHAGFTVFEANSAIRALETAQRERPAVMLLDVHLQDLIGYELFGLLRRNPQTRQIGIIFYAAFAPSDAARFVAQQLGAEGFLPSPIEPKALVACVQNTIAKLRITHGAATGHGNWQPN
jgi:CheY-like chemotaxis protein